MHGDFDFAFDGLTDLAHVSQITIPFPYWSEDMNPTVCKSTDPCVVCGKVNRNVELNSKQPRILATFCQEHAYERLPDRKQASPKQPEQD